MSIHQLIGRQDRITVRSGAELRNVENDVVLCQGNKGFCKFQFISACDWIGGVAVQTE